MTGDLPENEGDYGVECFEFNPPDEPLGIGDATKFFKLKKHALAWVETALAGARFKYFALYKRDGTDGWLLIEDFEVPSPFHPVAQPLTLGHQRKKEEAVKTIASAKRHIRNWNVKLEQAKRVLRSINGLRVR